MDIPSLRSPLTEKIVPTDLDLRIGATKVADHEQVGDSEVIGVDQAGELGNDVSGIEVFAAL